MHLDFTEVSVSVKKTSLQSSKLVVFHSRRATFLPQSDLLVKSGLRVSNRCRRNPGLHLFSKSRTILLAFEANDG